MIDLTVKTLDSKNHAFTVPDVITVKQLKERIASSVNISADSQRLIYCGRVLQDEKLLSEYDVNGKVIHLVQRAPPVNNSGGPDRGPAGARSATGASNPRRHWRELFGPGGNSGNAMYLGAMAFPAEIMDASGISMQQPRQCLSQSRLAVVRNMLSRASTILSRLENPPQESSETSPENGSTPPETNHEEDIASGGASIATLEISPGSFIIDNQQIDVGGPSVEVHTDAGSEANRATAAAAASEAGTALTNEQPAQIDNEESSNNETSRYPRTQVLAELLDQVAEVNSRMQPFMTQYQQLMRDDPTFSEETDVTANQRLFRSVSEIMHDLAHAYHALSDIMCDFSQPPPRSLRCRPVLIHHSAVVQAGIPIQVSGTLSGGNSSQQQSASASSGNSNSSESSNRSTAATAATTAAAMAATTAAAAMASAAVASSETPAATTEEPSAANGTEQTSRQTRPAAATRIGPVGASGPGFEFFVDVAPGSITIDSVEATVVTNGNQSTAEPNNWQNPPEFVQNLITALAGQFMGATLQQYRFSEQQISGTNSQQNNSAVSSSSNSEQVSSSTSSATAAATASSQARGNTATHPTTATQTRSTARPATTPHVHLSPTSLQGLRNNNFDPFLPCNSHHIRSNRTGRQRSASQPSGGINSTPETPRVVPIPTPSISISLRADPVISVEHQPSRSGPSQQTPLTLPPELQALIQSFRNVPNVSSEQIYPQQLAQLLQTIQGGQGNATLAQLLQNLPGYSYTSGESIFTDVFMTLAESLSFMDMVQLGLGSSECLVRARPRLQRFVTQRLLNNQPLTLSAITQIIDRFNNEIRPYFSVLTNARLREEVDLPASINLYNHSMLPCIINTVMEEDQSTFHRTLMRKCAQYVRQLSALLQYCCLDGVTGLESILRSFVDQMTTGVGGVLQEWTMNHSIINFRTFISTQNVSTDEIKRFLVYRMSNPATGASPQPASTPPIVPTAAEPMDIQETEELPIESTPSLLREPPLADVPPAQHINEVIGWQNAIPSEWVPIITRDSQRQRRQNSQGPFSDAYLSGMPSKRRKLITSTKPQGNLSQVISESMATALGAAGMSSGPEVDVIAQRAGQDSNLRTAYREQVRSTLRHNLSSNQDYTPEKYPNSAKYFKK